MNKARRYTLILIALLAVAASSIACDEKKAGDEIIQETQNTIEEVGEDVKETGYEIIQETQNTIKEVGEDVKEAVNDSDILSAPTGVELPESDGLGGALSDTVEDEAGK
jgi:predicted small secreted protein